MDVLAQGPPEPVKRSTSWCPIRHDSSVSIINATDNLIKQTLLSGRRLVVSWSIILVLLRLAIKPRRSSREGQKPNRLCCPSGSTITACRNSRALDVSFSV